MICGEDNMKERPTIGLVLGAGGAKGFAHIGVIEVLESAGIPIDFIVGCSIGAVIGGSYALGASTIHMEKAAKEISRTDIMDLRIPDRFGFIKGDKAEKLINNLICNALADESSSSKNSNKAREMLNPSKKKSEIKPFMFSDCKIPFYCFATDFFKAEGVVLSRGRILPAIRASFSIGGVFRPVKIGSKHLLDGGLISRVPVDIAKKLGADIIIAADCVGPTGAIQEKEIHTYFDTLMRVFYMLDYNSSKEEMDRADVLISMPQDVDSLKFKDLPKSIDYGREYAKAALPQIQSVIKKWKNKK